MKKNKLFQMYRYKNYDKKVNFLMLLIVFCFAFEVVTTPFFTKQILDIEIPNGNIRGILLFGGLYAVANIISCYLVLKFCIVRLNLGYKITGELKKDVFHKFMQIDTKFYDQNTTGTILQFLSNDAKDAGEFIPRIVVEMFVMGLFRSVAFSILLLVTNIQIGAGIVITYLLGILVTILLNRKTIALLKKVRFLTIEVLNQMNEGISGFTTIKSLQIEQQKIKKLDKTIQEYNKVSQKLNKQIAFYNAIFTTVTAFSFIWLIATGTMGLTSGFISYGLVMIMIEWRGALDSDVQWFLKHLTNFNRCYLAFCKILEFLNIDEVEKIEEGKQLNKITSIEFKNVEFGYNENQKILNNFNLTISPKQQIALVGRTGSGKSTILNLLCGFYKATNGNILINGEEIRKV